MGRFCSGYQKYTSTRRKDHELTNNRIACGKQIDEVPYSNKFAINFHASEQNADNCDLAFAAALLPVKNHMAAGTHFSVAFLNLTAIFFRKRISG